MTTTELTPAQTEALDIARGLAAAGIPIFLAPSAPDSSTGFALPKDWQNTEPDPSVVDRWRPGMALAAVMGRGMDLIDVDPRNGGDPGVMGNVPTSYGAAYTPSGGIHSFIRSLGVASHNNLFPGIDIKAGRPDGTGRGFAFIAPTVRTSKVTGEPAPYEWVQPPDLDAWATAGEDTSGAELAAQINAMRTSRVSKDIAGGPDWWRAFIEAREPCSSQAADRAIAAKLADVETWRAEQGMGFRTVLMRAALTLGGYVGSGYLDEAQARERLEAACSAVWTNPDADDLLWIEQGLSDGTEHPFPVYTPEDQYRWTIQNTAEEIRGVTEGAPPSTDIEDLRPPPPPPPWFYWSPLVAYFDPHQDNSDQGQAEALAAWCSPTWRYAKDAALWLRRERDVWETSRDETGAIITTAVKFMPLGEQPVPAKPEDRTPAHWQATRINTYKSAAGSNKIKSKLRDVVLHDQIRLAELDADPEVLWAGGIPWDLRASGELPVPMQRISLDTPHLRTAACAPDPLVRTPRWDGFLAAVWPDEEIRAWALRVLSVSLTGYPEAIIPMLYGRERSGKTSVVQLILTVLGGYAHAANPKLLAADSRDHDTMIFDLKGRRLSFIDEGPKRGHDATERLKQLTGGGALQGRPVQANPITWMPTHTLVMTMNAEPALTDPALRARARMIPCDSAEELVRPRRQALLGAGLLREAPGILAALMREAAAFLADRDSASVAVAPVGIRGLAEEIAQSQDPVREWVEACCVSDSTGTPSRELYNRFAGWHQDHPLFRRMSVPGLTMFGRTLSEMGFPAVKSGTKSRPLKVRSDSIGVMPWEPVPPGMTRAAPLDSSRDSYGQSAQELSTDENRRSTPVFTSGLDSTDSCSPLENTTTHTPIYKNWEAARENGPTVPTVHGEGAAGHLTSENVGLDSSGPVPDSDIRGESTAKNANPDANPQVKRCVQPSAAEVAARATADGISKPEARARLKAEARQAAIAQASGEQLNLPAVVTRSGAVVELTLDQAMAAIRACLREHASLTVDVEHTGYPVGHRLYQLRTVQLGDHDAAVVFDPVDYQQCSAIKMLLAEATTLHAHAATADLVPLVHAGLIDLAAWERMHDTVIAAKLADPRSTGSDAGGLKELAAGVLGAAAVSPAADEARANVFKAARWLEKTKLDTPIERCGWAQIDSRCTTMITYAASDVLDTAALARVLPPPPPDVFDRERLAQRMTARVSHHGMRIDPDHVRALTDHHATARIEASERVAAFGVENPGSDQQVGMAAVKLGAELEKTKTGRPSVAAGVLEKFRARDDDLGAFVRAVLDYRHHETVLGLFLEPYRQLIAHGDGRARPTVYTVGTDTGRMSCVRPNLQQLPRRGGVRACLTADPGQMLISADFSGVELRVAAALSRDPGLTQMIAEDRDLHWEVARQAFGEAATKEDRAMTKRGVFGRIYGGGIPTLARQVGVSEQTMAAVVASLDLLTPRLTEWAGELRDAVKAGHCVFPTYAGRRIHLPADYPHKAPNYCIQGSARELLVDALLRWRQTKWGECVLVPVHDELVIAVPEDDAEEASAALVACMQGGIYGIPIVASNTDRPPAFAWADAS